MILYVYKQSGVLYETSTDVPVVGLVGFITIKLNNSHSRSQSYSNKLVVYDRIRVTCNLICIITQIEGV